jgi:hypothetical protein
MAEVKRARKLLDQMEYYVSVMTESVLGEIIEEVDKECSNSGAIRELIFKWTNQANWWGNPIEK